MKSTGPRTPEGKRRSSRNAMRHGLLSSTVVLPNESPEAFAALLRGYETEFDPTTQVERDLVETMAVVRWRQMRLWGMEKAGLAHEIVNQLTGTEAAPDHATRAAIAFRSLADGSHSLELQSRYESRFDRQFYRALDRLESRRKKAANLPNELS